MPDMALMSVRAAAERLGIHANTVRRLIARGDLPHVQIGSRILLDPADVEEFVERGRRIGSAA